jgi:hypothetical protein
MEVPEMTYIQKFYSHIAKIISFYYCLLIIAAWKGPYGLIPEMQIWLVILSFYPISIFIWSTSRINDLREKIRHSHIEKINNEIQCSLQLALENKTKESAERLKILMDIQEQIQNLKLHPLFSKELITLALTSATACSQVLITILQYLVKK